jgi:hypothetical protein
MRDDDAQVRHRFAVWVTRHLDRLDITEAQAGEMIGRPSGWLDRFVLRRRQDNELTLREATLLVRILGGDPDVVFGETLDPRTAIDSSDFPSEGDEASAR